MKGLRRLLRSQRGDLMIESMVGALIIAIIMAAGGSVLMAATAASDGNDKLTSRSILLNTVLSDEKPNLATYTAEPRSVVRTINGNSISVAIWRETPAEGVTVLNAATPKPTAAAANADCSGPDRVSSGLCLTSRTVITTSNGGVDIQAVPQSPGTPGALADFTAPADATELRYIFKVTEAAGDSTVMFGNRDHPEVSHVVKIPAGQTGYFYGRVLVNAGSKLFVQSAGPASIDPASITIYEAPTT
ncbi:hypothetical protein [Arthrobacter sp. UYCo732]|uniref:hypothetical protein n=1 Tax=Arthrobacter sp. UYCo732 TaxID=3156336 RepID=UPI00339127E6